MQLRWTFLYLLLVPLVNWSFAHVPLIPMPDGGNWAPFAIVTGLVLVVRDFVQREIGHYVFIPLFVGVYFSYILAGPEIALASGAAFFISEVADWVVYTFTKKPLSERIMLSSLIAAPIDSAVFLFGASFAVQGIFSPSTLITSIASKTLWRICSLPTAEGERIKETFIPCLILMSERIIQIFTQPDQLETLKNIAEKHCVVEQWQGVSSDARLTYHILTDGSGNQALIDALQAALPFHEGKTRLVVLPVEAHLPVIEKDKQEEESEAKEENVVLREELHKQIASGAELDLNFLLLVCFATIVAAIGLIENNTAVLVGAMVIAPFLGPNLAQTFAAAMGERGLFLSALKTNLIGSGVSFALAFAIGFFFTLDEISDELFARAQVDYSSIFLALASGSAAVLSLTRGISSVLVGVMVAVALLPPLTASALFLGIGLWVEALNAALLLAVNIVCINLSGLLTFALRGIGPRSWWDKRKARSSVYWFSAVWGTALIVLFAIIAVRNNVWG